MKLVPVHVILPTVHVSCYLNHTHMLLVLHTQAWHSLHAPPTYSQLIVACECEQEYSWVQTNMLAGSLQVWIKLHLTCTVAGKAN